MKGLKAVVQGSILDLDRSIFQYFLLFSHLYGKLLKMSKNDQQLPNRRNSFLYTSVWSKSSTQKKHKHIRIKPSHFSFNLESKVIIILTIYIDFVRCV